MEKKNFCYYLFNDIKQNYQVYIQISVLQIMTNVAQKNSSQPQSLYIQELLHRTPSPYTPQSWAQIVMVIMKYDLSMTSFDIEQHFQEQSWQSYKEESIPLLEKSMFVEVLLKLYICRSFIPKKKKNYLIFRFYDMKSLRKDARLLVMGMLLFYYVNI